MKFTFFLLSFLLLDAFLFPAQADSPTAFEKPLYEKARYSVLSKVGDQDLVSYCVSMNIGGETLLRLHDDIMVKQAELANLISEGFNNDHPQVMAVNGALKNLRAQYVIKIAEVRRALELEASIADATLAQLPK